MYASNLFGILKSCKGNKAGQARFEMQLAVRPQIRMKMRGHFLVPASKIRLSKGCLTSHGIPDNPSELSPILRREQKIISSTLDGFNPQFLVG